MEVKRVLLVAHPAHRMYDLIEGAEHYPAFLPWCSRAVVTERTEAVVAADIDVDWHGVRLAFATRNEKRRPTWMGVRLARGPFRHFEGTWDLHPLGEEGCRIVFELRYDFENPLLRTVAGHVFERITNTLVDAFVARADALGPAIPVPVRVGPQPPDAPAPAPTAPAGQAPPAASPASPLPAATHSADPAAAAGGASNPPTGAPAQPAPPHPIPPAEGTP